MDADEFITWLTPFRRFRIFLSDGCHFDVRHPELAIVGFTTVTLLYPEEGVPEELNMSTVLVSLNQITRLEYI